MSKSEEKRLAIQKGEIKLHYGTHPDPTPKGKLMPVQGGCKYYFKDLTTCGKPCWEAGYCFRHQQTTNNGAI